ncbi:MAG: hypothetical protein ACD_47C00013G0003 [uncultured bacterium]|uniref:Uncharacterized protein n=1 Tax=Candidatus Wallbacteria bacterium GWC2_49_35 TaxID=1817813 RepID=A0A1F7WTB9_9BACT|nr:MAG: hypothetical protein ACD_47C00013G0003 [uncultured bacterium]OGM06016.1 MAG: hypothetical protein A2008_12520 [Candidatus Wallbacteria bacterium GWC2_49_35]HBC74493.1 hypothetical protein [Candidatus Wallbacteria bacterium]
MTKNQNHAHHDKKIETGSQLFTDAETIAIIDAQCEEHKTSRAKFIAVVTRLFLDFSYIAKTVGKDVFSFRDEMIKAIVRSKGNSDTGEIIEKIGREESAAGSGDGEPKASELRGIKEKFSGMARELSELRAAFVELKNALGGVSEDQSGRRNGDRKKDRRHQAEDDPAKDKKHEAITVDELAQEFKNSVPPSYKDKRKKLHKLKF